MHRLAHFKLKKKSLHDYNRFADKEPAADQSNNSLPVLELSLSDSKSFRASIILPDLSRRFTLLRRNGEPLPINNFCEHVRHELATGQITEEDENILIHQYRQQYLRETPSYSHHSPTSPSEANTALLPSPAHKVTPKATHLLFPGNSAARDAAYIHKIIRMSKKQTKSAARQSDCRTGDALTEQIDSVSPIEDTSEYFSLPIPLDNQITAPSSQVNQANPTKSAHGESEDKISIQLTQAQLRRLSLAVDRILGSHQTENPKASNLKLESNTLQNQSNLPTGPRSPSTALDAESRVHEELSRALPIESSPTPYSVNQSCKNEAPLSQASHLKDNSVIEPTLYEESADGLYDEDLELLPENDFENDSSVFESDQFDFDDCPQRAPTFDREQPLSLVDWTPDDAHFIQSTLLSSHSNHFQQQPPAVVDLTYDDALFIQSALCSLHDLQSQQPLLLKTEDQTERKYSVSTCPSSSVISPRSSSLQHRLNLAKNFAMHSDQKMAQYHQPSDKAHSPTETSFSGPSSSLHQKMSPSVGSPDACSFPLTPPLVARSSVGQAYIPSSPIDSNPSPNEICEPHPRGFNSRAGRTIPTTILFRDVEAQVVAANAALRQVSSAQADGATHVKKFHSRKKSISTAQVGAPMLLSASAKLTELDLAKIGMESSTIRTDTSKDISKKSSFKLRLRKKRPSDARLSHDNTEPILDATPRQQDSSNRIQLNESTPTAAPTSASSRHARDSIPASPTQTCKHRSTDAPESHPSWKQSNHLTDRVRKLMGRQRKPTSNPVLASKHNLDSTTSIVSNDTSSDLAILSQGSHLRTPDDPQELGLESESTNVWPPSAVQSACHSQSLSQLGLSSSDIPSRDSYMDDQHRHDSLHVSVTSPDLSSLVPVKNSLRRSWAKRQSFLQSQPNSLYDIRQSHLETDDPTAPTESAQRKSSNVNSISSAVVQLPSPFDGSTHAQAPLSPWLEAPGSEHHSAHSDCASSILDLYGCDSQSTTASSPKRSSSASCYSNPYDLSRPISGLFPSNRIQNLQSRPNGLLCEQEGGNIISPNGPHPIQSNQSSKQRNSSQKELMVMVQQLQNSTRYSQFETARSSFNPKDDSSAASFIKHIVKGNPDGNSFKMINGNSQVDYADDDDEAEVWKQILKG